MERPRLYNTEAIVLKHLPIGEADRIVTLYTLDRGKLRAVGRGVRRTKSRLAGHLELLTRTRVLIARGRSLDTISQSESIDGNLALRGELWRMSCGLYMAELVDHFTEEGLENAALYRLLRSSLAALPRARNVDLLLRYFELRLLDLSGYRPEVYRCVECATPLSPTPNYFSPGAGGVLCPSCRPTHSLARPLSLNALKVLRLFSQGDLETASKLRMPGELAAELEATMRQYIHYLLEREVKSTGFLDLLRREGAGALAAQDP